MFIVQLIEDYLSGASSLIIHQGIGAVLFTACLAGAYFVPLLRKYFIGAAFIVLAAVIFEDIGIHDADKLTKEKEKIVNTQVDHAVAHSKTAKARKAKDPWDRKEY
jgi:hypothetical protein